MTLKLTQLSLLCPVCGAEVSPTGRRGPRRTYCSEACKQAAYRRRAHGLPEDLPAGTDWTAPNPGGGTVSLASGRHQGASSEMPSGKWREPRHAWEPRLGGDRYSLLGRGLRGGRQPERLLVRLADRAPSRQLQRDQVASLGLLHT